MRDSAGFRGFPGGGKRIQRKDETSVLYVQRRNKGVRLGIQTATVLPRNNIQIKLETSIRAEARQTTSTLTG